MRVRARTIVALAAATALVVGSAGASAVEGPLEVRNGRIAFMLGSLEGATDVGSIRPSGRRLLNLTDSEEAELYVDVSPDGELVAFTRFSRFGGEIFTVPILGGPATRLTHDHVHDELPIWSPDGSQIAFVRYANHMDPEIFVMDADGSNRVRVTDNAADEADPRFSPDGTHLIYTSGNIDLNEQDVFLTTLGVPGAIPLTSPGVNDSFAEWSPDGTQVVYASFRDEQWDVFVVSSDGTETTRLTDDPADDYAPRWSPDGSRVVYVNGRLEGVAPPDRVHVMNADGSGSLPVSPGRLDAFSASFALNGRRIVFVGKVDRGLNWELFTVGAHGIGLRRLTRSDAMEFDPSWARRAG